MDRAGVLTMFHVNNPESIISTVSKVDDSPPDSPDLTRETNENDSAEYIAIMKAFRSGVYFPGKSQGMPKSKVISTKTKGFSENEIKKALDSSSICSIKNTVLYVLRKDKKHTLLIMMYDLEHPIIRGKFI